MPTADTTETLDQLSIGAEPLIVRGRREWHGTLTALLWCESRDGRFAWHERRVLAVTVAAFPDRLAAAEAGRRLWGAPTRPHPPGRHAPQYSALCRRTGHHK